MHLLFLGFLIIPIVELLLLIKVGQFIGVVPTVMLVLMTAILGVSVLKKQGLSTFNRANLKMRSGQMPVAEVGEGLMLAFAGALLLTPGFVTDTCGFLLLVPGIRRWIADRWLKALVLKAQGDASYSQAEYRSESFRYPPNSVREGDIIEGEYQEEPKENPRLEK